MLAAQCNQSRARVREDTRRARYLTPYEAREYGLLDGVLEPGNPVYRDIVRDWRGGPDGTDVLAPVRDLGAGTMTTPTLLACAT